MHDFLSLARLSRGQVLDVWSVVSAERMVLRPRHYTGHALQTLFLPVAAQCDLLAGAVLQRGCERADVKTILSLWQTAFAASVASIRDIRALLIEPLVAELLALQRWQRLLLRASKKQVLNVFPNWPDMPRAWFNLRCATPRFTEGKLDTNVLKGMANTLRGWSDLVLSGASGAQRDERLGQLEMMTACFEELGALWSPDRFALKELGGRSFAFKAQVLLSCVCSADLLRDNAQLKDSIRNAILLVVPAPFVGFALDMLDGGGIELPKRETIRVNRFFLDVSFMLYMRDADLWQGKSVHLCADSSPQGGPC